jgi:membrane protein DedA with SNARE-associated domain
MLQGLGEYGYWGIFATLLAAGFGFPMPEELPVLTAGIMVGHDPSLHWYIMLPVIMAGVVLGDTVLYGVGRVWGRRLLNLGFVRRNLVPLEKQEQIEKNFTERGIWVLLGARMLPGIRAPVFVVAGVLRVPLGRFMFADGIYAIPLVNILFWLAYFLTDQAMDVFNKIKEYKQVTAIALLSAVAGALFHKYVLSRSVSTGEPPHVPNIISKPAAAAAHAVEHAVEKVMESVTGRHHDRPHEERPPEGAAEPEFGIRTREPSANGAHETAAKESPPPPPPGPAAHPAEQATEPLTGRHDEGRAPDARTHEPGTNGTRGRIEGRTAEGEAAAS